MVSVSTESKFARRLAAVSVVVALAVLYAVGVSIRRYVVEHQLPERGRPLPFTLESALRFRAIRAIYAGQGLPAIDRELQGPDGVRTFAYDTVGSEYVIAALARLFPAEITLTDRVRWISVLWFCLGVPVMAVWIRRATGSWSGGMAAGLLYAVSLGAVIRSTGQELSHENFSLPWLLGHLAAAAGPPLAGRREIGRWGLSAALLAVALATWDMTQYYVLLAGVAALARWVRTPWALSDERASPSVALAAAAAIAWVASPYLRSHRLPWSPMVWPLWGVLAGMAVASLRVRGRPPTAAACRLAAAAAVAAIALAGRAEWGAPYGHFASLLWAKLRFLNRKPADPSLLTFEQRILWTPALDSADWSVVRTFFPAALPLTAVVSVVSCPCWRKNQSLSPGFGTMLFFHWISVIMFVLFIRFCVFAALSTSAVLGWWLSTSVSVRSRMRAAVAGVLGLAALAEAGVVLGGADRWGLTPVMYPQLEEMGEWIRTRLPQDGRAVLANFQTSPFILTYGRRPIVLHPKFEAPDMRERVETFARLMFRGSEKALRDWADGLGVGYVVYAMGEFTDRHPEYTLRYMVDALVPPPSVPARLFEFHPERLERFQMIWHNAKYRVFRLVSVREEANADAEAAAARAALERGDLVLAETMASQAWRRMPRHTEAAAVLERVAGLRAAGFGTDGAAPPP